MPLPCPVDLDSLCMLLGSDIKNAETGPQAEVWDWRSVLCGIARSSRLPELQNSGCPDRFCEIGMTYVLDLSVWGMHSSVESPGGGLETVACLLRLPYRVYYDCDRAWLYMTREMDIPLGQSRKSVVRGKLGTNRDVCAKERSLIWARPEVCVRDDGYSPKPRGCERKT